ncbi:MAG TPA: DMT family transporter [Candidatus Aphodovivens avistercoris]|nr:DMT family transporter [Candidatus Aphodovivens avistercoris]
MGTSYAAYLSSLLLFGSNGIVAALVALPSSNIVVARTGLGAALLGVLLVGAALARRAAKRNGAAPARAGRLSDGESRALVCFALSGAALGAGWIVLFEAYRLVGVGTASLLYYCGPIIVMAAAPLLFKERLTAAKMGGFAAVALGAFLVSAQALEGGSDPRGLLLGGVSALAYAVMVVCTKKAASFCPNVAERGLRNAFVQLAAAFAVAAALAAAVQGPGALLVPVAPGDAAPLLMLGLVNTGVGCFLYFTSVGRLPVQTVAVCGYVEPLSAVLLSALLLGEPLGAVQIAGALLIVGGAAFCELSGRLRAARRLDLAASLEASAGR